MVVIIVLIILASVTLSVTLGENGIITKSKQAVDKYQDAAKQEQEEQEDVYLELDATKIYTQADLAKIADNPEGNYQLENDIELDDTWTPIDTFSGILNGNGYTIIGFADGYESGIIKQLCKEGTIKNLKRKANVSDGAYCYGIVSENRGVIQNCIVDINMTNNSEPFGRNM